MSKKIVSWYDRLLGFGLLRLTLLASTLIVTALLPVPGTPSVYRGWAFVTTVLAPVMAPILFMLVTFDALMARVFLKEATPTMRGRLKSVITIDLVIATVLMARWLPFFLSLRA